MTGSGVLVFSGPPCSGKSSVAKALAADSSRTSTVIIEIDDLFTVLFPKSDWNRTDRMLAYDASHEMARMLVERGRTVVVECTYSRRQQRASLVSAIASIPSAPLWVVEFAVPADHAVKRWHHRNLTKQLVRKRNATFPYSDQTLRLDTSTAAPHELAQQINMWLAGHPTPVQRDVWAAGGNDWD